MKFDPFLSDEPALAPAAPGAALVRLSQLLGGLRRIGEANYVPVSSGVPKVTEKIEIVRQKLILALENDEGVAPAVERAQIAIRTLYVETAAAITDSDARAEALLALGYRDPRITDIKWVAPIDVRSVVVTHFKPVRQVFTTIAFDEAHGATAYWLSEVRFFQDQRVVEQVVENYAPQFTRIRLPVGPHTFYIESRNSHGMVRSEEFGFEVPAL